MMMMMMVMLLSRLIHERRCFSVVRVMYDCMIMCTIIRLFMLGGTMGKQYSTASAHSCVVPASHSGIVAIHRTPYSK